MQCKDVNCPWRVFVGRVSSTKKQAAVVLQHRLKDQTYVRR